MPGVILQSRLSRRPVDISQRQGPDPTFLETMAAGFRTASDEQGLVQAEEISAGYRDIEATLEAQGYDRSAWHLRTATGANTLAAGQGFAPATQDRIDKAKLWATIMAARARNPKLFPDIPASPDDFERNLLERRGQRRADLATASRGNTVARIIGSAGAGFQDPLTVATLPIGGASKSILGAIASDALINAGLAAAMLPDRAANLARLGEEMTAEQAIGEIGTAAITGGLLGGGGKVLADVVAPAVGRVAGRAADSIASGREAALARIYDVLPDRLKARWKSSADIRDTDLPEIAEAMIGRDNMSADERAAADLIRRDSEVRDANPFVPNGAGVAAHEEGFAEALAAVMGRAPAPSRRAELLAGTSAGGGTSFAPARDALKARIRAVESSGNDAARSASDAVGRYQFLGSTWLRYYRRRFGNGESDAAVLAKRTDPNVQEMLVDDLLADNSAFLRRQGEAESAGNLYLVHFAGQGGARKLFDADPATPARNLFSPQAVRNNPFLADMTAGDVIAWAHRKMNERPPPRAGARAVIDGGGSEAASVQAEIDRLAAERQTLQAQKDAIAGEQAPLPEAPPLAPDPVDLNVPPVAALPDAEPLPAPLPDAEPLAVARSASAPEPAPALNNATLGSVRDYVNSTKGSMMPGNIAKQLDLPEGEVMRALQTLAGRPNSNVKMTRYGKFRRSPTQGPMDLMKFIARQGGLRDDEGHSLVDAMELQAFIPGAGMLIRKNGMSIDRARELAAEAGYFTDRDSADAFSNTTEADFLELLDNARGRNSFSLFDEAKVAARNADRQARMQREYWQNEVELAAIDLAITPDRAIVRRAADIAITDGLAGQPALIAAINERLQDVMDAIAEASQKERYEILAEEFAAFSAERGVGDARSDGGPGAAASVAGRSGGAAVDGGNIAAIPEPRPAGGRADADAALTDNPPANEAAAAPFRDPDSAAVQQQSDSLWHDLEAAVDPSVAARDAEMARLGAEAPMQPKVDQDSTIGAPLFDAVDQGSFAADVGTVRTDLPMRLDADAPEMTAAQLVDKLNREEVELKAIRDCL